MTGVTLPARCWERRRSVRRATALVAFAVLAGCKGRSAATPAEPKLEIDGASLHDERVEQGSPLKFRLRLMNQGGDTLHVQRIAGPGVCRGLEPPKAIEPREDAELDVVCESAAYGPFRATLELHSDDPRSPHGVGLQGEVLPRLALESATVELDTEFGVDVTRELIVSGTRWRDARLDMAPLEARDLTAELMPGAGEVPPRLRLVLRARKVGVEVGQVVVRTGLGTPDRLTLHYRTQVRGTLSVEPPRPYLNLRFAPDRSRVLRVSSSQPGFKLLSASIVEGPFTARVLAPDRGAPERYEVEVGVDTQRLSPEVRGVSGRLRLVSNDRSEPEREIPLLALGKVGAADVERPAASTGEP